MDVHPREHIVTILVVFILYTSHSKPSLLTSSSLSLSSSSSSSSSFAEATASTATTSKSSISEFSLNFYHNICVTTSDTTKSISFTTTSRIHCAVACMKRSTCLGVSYNPTTLLCHTNDLAISSPGVLVVQHEDCLYMEVDERIEWHLVLRANHGIGHSVYNTWQNTGHHDDVNLATIDPIGCLTVDGRLPCDKHLRTWRLDDWSKVALVKHAFFIDSQQVFFVNFDASGLDSATRDNHFRVSRIVDSSATQLVGYTGRYNFNSVIGHSQCHRRFFLNKYYNGCHDDLGWMLVNDPYPGCCHYEKTEPQPNFMYTPHKNAVNWLTGDVGRAQVYAVFVKYED